MKIARVSALALLGLSLGLLHGLSAQEPPCTITVQPNGALQRAIDQASPGAVICLPTGVWAEHLTVKKNLTLRGEGATKTVLKGVREGHPVMVIEADSEIEVILERLAVGETQGFCAVANPQWVCADGVQARGQAKVVLKDLRLSGNKWRGLFATNSAKVQLINVAVVSNRAGLFVTDSAQVALTNSQAANNEDIGLFAENAAQVALLSSQVSRNGWQGLVAGGATQVLSRNSQFIGNGYDGLLAKDTVKLDIHNSIFRDNGECGLSILSEKVQAQGTPNEMGSNGADLCGFAPAALRQPLVAPTARTQLSVPNDYKNLQEAVDAVAPGGMVTLAAGTHETGVTLWKPLKLRGAGRAQTTLKAPRHIVVSIIAEAQNVSVEALTVAGSSTEGVSAYGQVSFQDVQFVNHFANGLSVRGTAVVTLSNSQLSANNTGVSVAGAARLSVENSQIVRNSGVGLVAAGAAQVQLINSTVAENKDHGLSLEGSTNTTLSGSVVSENARSGIYLLDAAAVTLNGARVLANRFDGLWARGAAVVEIRQSTIEGNGTDRVCPRPDQFCNGIEAWERAQVTVSNSKISNNADWGVAAYLMKCGYSTDSFMGKFVIDAATQITGNNKTANHPAPGNVCVP